MPARKLTILSADDDPHLLHLVTRNLTFEGYEVLTASDGVQALEQIEAHQPDLVLLDVMMPRMDGFAVCQRVRECSTVPIIIVMAREQDKVRGLDLGADDYLTKPFSLDELLARVAAVLRRAKFNPREHPYATHTTIGELSIDHAQRLVTRAGREVKLTPTEYSLLAYLAHNAGRIVLQDAILEHVWGKAYVGEGHLLQVNVSRLRHKLEPDPVHPCYLLTKTGIGYLLAATHQRSDGIQVGHARGDGDCPSGADKSTLELAYA
jgi:DNA-binding response OmpR family regulator